MEREEVCYQVREEMLKMYKCLSQYLSNVEKTNFIRSVSVFSRHSIEWKMLDSSSERRHQNVGG